MKKELCDKKEDIQLEISKRREILEKKLNSASAKNKVENKVDKISSKLLSVEEKVDKTNQYYRDEISKANKKLDDELSILRSKLELQEKILNDKFEAYRIYCHSQMTITQSNAEKTKENLETVVEKLEKLSDVDEDADTILSGLKIKLEQIEKQLKEATVRVNYENDLREKREKFRVQEIIAKDKKDEQDIINKRIEEANKAKEQRTRDNEAEQERYMARRAKQDIVEIEEQKESEEEMKQRKKEERKLKQKELNEFLAINNREEKLYNLTVKQENVYGKIPVHDFIQKGKFLDAIK